MDSNTIQNQITIQHRENATWVHGLTRREIVLLHAFLLANRNENIDADLFTKIVKKYEEPEYFDTKGMSENYVLFLSSLYKIFKLNKFSSDCDEVFAKAHLFKIKNITPVFSDYEKKKLIEIDRTNGDSGDHVNYKFLMGIK